MDLNKLTCEVCKVSMFGLAPMEQHLKGQKHLKNVAQMGSPINLDFIATRVTIPTDSDAIQMYTCQTCSVTMNGPQPYEQHMRSSKHLKKAVMPVPQIPFSMTRQEPITDSKQLVPEFAKYMKDVVVIREDEKIADVIHRLF